MYKIGLEWRVLDRDHVALIFDKKAFAAFQSIADSRGVETTDMIAETLANLLGPVLARRLEE